MNDLLQQRSAKLQEGGHSCPPIKTHGGLENPPSFVSDGQDVERNFGEDQGTSSAPDYIPSDWKWLPLGEFITEAQYGLSTKANAETGVPLLRMTNQENGRITARDLKFVELDEKDKMKFKVEVGDILFNRTNSFELVGRTAMFDLPGDFVFASYLIRLRTKPDKLLSEFLTFYFMGEEAQRRLKSIATRAVSQSNISATRLKGFPIPLPPLPEQKKIAHILSTVQRAIEAQERTIQTTTELKKALMHKLFTEGLRSEPQKQTVIGPVPESWSPITLGELCEKPNGALQTGPFGSQLHKDEYQENGIAVVNPTHLAGNRINHEHVPRVSEEVAQRLGKHRLRKFDILFARRGEIGRKGLVTEAEESWLCGTGCFLVRASKSFIDNRFLALYFATDRLVKWLNSHAAGAIMPNLNNSVMQRLPVFYPDSDTQTAIIETFATIDQKLRVAIRKQTMLQDLFRTLLHELMTAKFRVNTLIFRSKAGN